MRFSGSAFFVVLLVGSLRIEAQNNNPPFLYSNKRRPIEDDSLRGPQDVASANSETRLFEDALKSQSSDSIKREYYYVIITDAKKKRKTRATQLLGPTPGG